MLNNKSNKNLLLPALIALSSLTIISCGGGSDSEKAPPPTTTPPVVEVPLPATEHHEKDNSKTQNTTVHTVAKDNKVTSIEKNYSQEAKVTDPMQVSSTVDETYPIGKVLHAFNVENDFVIGSDKIDNINSKIFSYSLKTNAVITTIDTALDDRSSEVSFNGFILGMHAGEIINMYHIDDKGVIGQHFFTTDSGTGGYGSGLYLDHDYGYFVDSTEIKKIKISDTKSIKPIYTLPGQTFTTRIVSDENSLYATYSERNGTSAEVIIINKKDETFDRKFSFADADLASIAVDGNYIYLSDKTSGDVLVYNKHTLVDSGKITVGEDTLVYYDEGKLYIYLQDKKELQKHTVTFAAP